MEKYFFLLVGQKRRWKRTKYLEREIFFGGEKNGERKGGKYLEQENISIFALYPSISIEMCGKEIEQKTD